MAAAHRIPEGAGVEWGEARVGGGPLGPVGGPENGEDGVSLSFAGMLHEDGVVWLSIKNIDVFPVDIEQMMKKE